MAVFSLILEYQVCTATGSSAPLELRYIGEEVEVQRG